MIQLDLFKVLVKQPLKRPLRRRFQLPSSYQHRGLQIPVNLVRVRRRKYMAIHVLQGGGVEVRTPVKCPNHEIDLFIRSRLDWIVQAREKMAEFPARLEPEYKQGEMHPYLGKLYALHLVESKRNKVKLANDQLVIGTSDLDDSDKIRNLLHGWYKQEALRVFPYRLNRCLQTLDGDIKMPAMTIRKMKSRWGSCSRDRVICLNSLLVQKPVEAIDFVITHELCHLSHFNHGREFYDLMNRLMPDWRRREALLEQGIY